MIADISSENAPFVLVLLLHLLIVGVSPAFASCSGLYGEELERCTLDEMQMIRKSQEESRSQTSAAAHIGRHSHSGEDPQWFSCKEDSDCEIVFALCGPVLAHKSFREMVNRFEMRAHAREFCRASPIVQENRDLLRQSVICFENRCSIDDKRWKHLLQERWESAE